MEKLTTLVFHKGSIVRAYRRTIVNKYSNLPGFRELHDFLTLRNHGQDSAMKVRDNCYTSLLKNTPMKTVKGMNAIHMALPSIGHSYYAPGITSKLSHFNQMCANFIPPDRWHTLSTNS